MKWDKITQKVYCCYQKQFSYGVMICPAKSPILDDNTETQTDTKTDTQTDTQTDTHTDTQTDDFLPSSVQVQSQLSPI